MHMSPVREATMDRRLSDMPHGLDEQERSDYIKEKYNLKHASWKTVLCWR